MTICHLEKNQINNVSKKPSPPTRSMIIPHADAQTGSTPSTGEVARQVTTPISETTEYILPPVDPSLSIKQEDMPPVVKVEANQVEKGEGDIPVCGLCQKSFASVSGRNLHIRTLHEGERYACQVCDKLFNRKDRLNQHISHVPRVRNRTTVLNVVKTLHRKLILDNTSFFV